MKFFKQLRPHQKQLNHVMDPTQLIKTIEASVQHIQSGRSEEMPIVFSTYAGASTKETTWIISIKKASE
jgi:hypothetical protein